MRTLTAAVTVALTCLVLAGCGSSTAATVAASTTTVTFTVDGSTTYGTLDVPAHRSGEHLAAALLLAGSGPTDRNGNQEPSLTPNTLKQIAAALDRMGIMSLRFDKYFAGRTGAGVHASDPGSLDLNAFIRQADAAYRMLSAQPAADRARMLVIGHSEGGMYAILVAGTVTPHPAGLALVEPQDARFLDILDIQINEGLDAQVARGAITVAVAKDNARRVREAISAFRAGRTPDTSGLLPPTAALLNSLIVSPINANYVRTDDAIYPPDYAAKLPSGLRVLVTDGTADTNVPPSTITPLVTALTSAGITGPGLRLLNGLDHYLNPAGTPSNNAPLDPSFLTELTGWARPYTRTS